MGAIKISFYWKTFRNFFIFPTFLPLPGQATTNLAKERRKRESQSLPSYICGLLCVCTQAILPGGEGSVVYEWAKKRIAFSRRNDSFRLSPHRQKKKRTRALSLFPKRKKTEKRNSRLTPAERNSPSPPPFLALVINMDGTDSGGKTAAALPLFTPVALVPIFRFAHRDFAKKGTRKFVFPFLTYFFAMEKEGESNGCVNRGGGGGDVKPDRPTSVRSLPR